MDLRRRPHAPIQAELVERRRGVDTTIVLKLRLPTTRAVVHTQCVRGQSDKDHRVDTNTGRRRCFGRWRTEDPRLPLLVIEFGQSPGDPLAGARHVPNRRQQ